MTSTTISTHALHLQRRDAIATAQRQIALVSNELASGYKADVSASLGRTTGQLIGLLNKFHQTAEMKQNIASTASRMEMMAAQIVRNDELGSEFLARSLPNAINSPHSAGTLQDRKSTSLNPSHKCA